MEKKKRKKKREREREGLTCNSALTLEHLEATFYAQAFATLDDAAFNFLNVSPQQLADLRAIGDTEAAHVVTLQSALAQNGVQPVRPCEYDFAAALADAETMLATASVLESVGVSAYLGAAPLLSDPAILGVAGSILTVEARHQSSIRVFAQDAAVPQAFDVPLGPRAVFSLAAPFIKSCPDGSNLVLEAFPVLDQPPAEQVAALADPANGPAVLRLQSESSGQATHCAFTSGGVQPGGTIFTAYTPDGGCEVPHNVAGVSYVSLTSSDSLEGLLSDDIVVAGPIALSLT